MLTVVAGLSATIFIPLTQWLVEAVGWQDATLTLGAVMLAIVGSLALLVARDRSREEARMERLDPKSTYAAMVAGLRYTNRAFWLSSAGYFLGLAGTFLMLFHQVAYLQDLGFPVARVATAVGTIGVISLPGPFLFSVLGDYVRPLLLIAVIFGLLAISALLLLETGVWWRVYTYIALFGVVFGSVLPMRAAVMPQHFSGALYGRLMGCRRRCSRWRRREERFWRAAGYDRLLGGTLGSGGDVRRRHTADSVGRFSHHHAGRHSSSK